MKLLLFDAGGTLVFPDWALIAEALARHGVRVDPAALEAAEPRARWRMDRPDLIARSTDRSRWRIFFDEVLREAGVSSWPDEPFEELHALHERENLWSHVPDLTRRALDRLRGRRMGVVSNANGTVRRKLVRLGLDAYFEDIVDSHDVGVEKPDPRIFEIALKRLGAAPVDAVYVGDFYHLDVAGARAAGIDAFLLDPLGLHADKDCRRIRTLEEFADAVAR